MHAVSSLALTLFLALALPAQQLDPATAWRQFTADSGQDWSVQWNPATGTPSAIYGPGLALGKRIDDLTTARREASALFDRHARLLGRGESTFVETIGVKARQVYVLVYEQQYKGLPVISGRADVRIHEVGTVALFGASAIPIPNGLGLEPKLEATRASQLAVLHVLGESLGGAAGQTTAKLVIWADSSSQVQTTPALAWEVQIDARPTQLAVGKAYVDAANGAILQFKNEVYECSCGSRHLAGSTAHRSSPRLERAMTRLAALRQPTSAAPRIALTGTVMAWTNLGILPVSPRTNTPLANLLVTSSAGNAYTDANGKFSIPYTGTAAVTVTATLTGRHTQRIVNAAGGGMLASASITPGTAGTIQFSTQTAGQNQFSQTTTYWHVDDANVWLRQLLPGATGPMNTISAITPRVNINSSCNAYYTRNTINFYRSGGSCNMTAFQTVIYHEWGHGLDAVFGGISQIDGLSEGWGDILGLYRSGQPELGPGFRVGSTTGIRSGNNTLRYPQTGGVHTMGQTWMGWAWDLRKNLIATHGASTGIAIAERIVVASIAADATNQPNAVREVFILDDDDGNLNNGTPNYADLEKASLKRNLPYPKRINPNAGSYLTFGAGCAGSGQLPGNCLNVNTTGSLRTGSTRSGITYAIQAIAPSNLKITGFELYTSGGQTVTTRIYSVSPFGQPLNILASSQMVVGSSRAWYQTKFQNAVSISAGQKFFVAFVNNAATISSSTRLGTAIPYFRNDGAGGSWNGPIGTVPWAYKINCPGGSGAVPALSNSGVPEIARSFQVKLSAARASSAGFLIAGASDSSWSGRSLPLDLGGFGAGGCKLLASLDILVAITTNSSGASTQNFNIPNDQSLFGVEFFNQYAVADPVNAFGMVMSNGGHGKIGKQ